MLEVSLVQSDTMSNVSGFGYSQTLLLFCILSSSFFNGTKNLFFQHHKEEDVATSHLCSRTYRFSMIYNDPLIQEDSGIRY